MKTTLIIIASVIVFGAVAYFIFFPKNTFITFWLKDKSGITFSRTSINWRHAPDYYPENGFDHLGSYISKLLKFSDNFKNLIISTPEGDKALGLDSRSGILNVGFTVEWKQEPEKERLIREYFRALDLSPSQDYLANNGGIPDSTRILDYQINGNEKEITELIKDILIKLCDISETDAIRIYYDEET